MWHGQLARLVFDASAKRKRFSETFRGRPGLLALEV
jgi:hypothetical protein